MNYVICIHFYLNGRHTDKLTRRLSAGLLPVCLQQSWLDQAETWAQNLKKVFYVSVRDQTIHFSRKLDSKWTSLDSKDSTLLWNAGITEWQLNGCSKYPSFIYFSSYLLFFVHSSKKHSFMVEHSTILKACRIYNH